VVVQLSFQSSGYTKEWKHNTPSETQGICSYTISGKGSGLREEPVQPWKCNP